ncbi:UDP-N-acetylenolpyruvoylglucosamine reductase [Candidatus Liberibacter americanus PW_SP]|nr:UDP-N-acetylenolpyruvoylglucosamine reductase [Candidatus Liberibacter americanus PW_SP]
MGYYAWKLLDDAKFPGLTFGVSKISELHCNFMFNTGNDTGYDIEYLGELVCKKFLFKVGILLEWKINRIGEFDDEYQIFL